MNRREFLMSAVGGAALAAVRGLAAEAPRPRPPNIILILADDLGWGDLGCYGQKIIRTPYLDQLAADGARFTQAYSGSAVCAPSRCMLLTGRHAGHASIRDNREVGAPESYEGQMPLPAEDVTIAQILKDAGYATACIGKWGLGRTGSTGDPNKHGFDLFFGYNCQRHAHNHYPAYLLRNAERVPLPGNDGTSATGQTYAPDRLLEEALTFIRASREKPFFLYYATTVPHQALQVPEDSLKEYAGKIEEKGPYDGAQGYQPQKSPRAAYAAMVTRLDRDVGQILRLIDNLGLRGDTVVVFTSDNGATDAAGADPVFFQSNGALRGSKGSLYEGGIRAPLIVNWPGRIKGGNSFSTPCGCWDLPPTLCEAAGLRAPGGMDGISLLPQLRGGEVPVREYLYWEFPGSGGQQAIRLGSWKGIRRQMAAQGSPKLELYNLADDPAEANDLAASHPDVIRRMEEVMAKAHTVNPAFPLKPLDPVEGPEMTPAADRQKAGPPP